MKQLKLLSTFFLGLTLCLFCTTIYAQDNETEDIVEPYIKYADPADEPFDDIEDPSSNIETIPELNIVLPDDIPRGNNIPEEDTTNGIDDDKDDLIDEGPSRGNCMVVIYCSDKSEDDEWALRVDNILMGTLRKKQARFWTFNLEPGEHRVNVEEVFDLENTGEYNIWFGNCNKVKGPPIDPFNSSEQEFFDWTIEVPQ
ncbi:MAG: hypothetical protein AB1782_07510 [Cyanobacteriota bacterium]